MSHNSAQDSVFLQLMIIANLLHNQILPSSTIEHPQIVCVCVCERERERKKETERATLTS